MWGLVLKVLGTGLFKYLKARQNTSRIETLADAGVNVAMLHAYVESEKVAAQIQAENRGSPWTCWMMPVAFGLCMLHFGLIILDSLPLFGHLIGSWHIAALPEPYPMLQRDILYAGAGVAGANVIGSIVRKVFSK